jgi:hypothetical protein
MKCPIRLAFALCVLASGCTGPEVPLSWNQGNLDTRDQGDGTVLILDTHRNWRLLSSTVEAEVKREAAGFLPPGNSGSWRDFWSRDFSEIRSLQEHPEKYFAMILNVRRRAGLPDLPKTTFES